MKIQGKQLADTLRSESSPFDIVYADKTIGSLDGAVSFSALNNYGSIGKGKAVYITGSSGNTPTIAPANATISASKAPAFGLTSKASVLNDTVDIITFGNLKGVDTSLLAVGTVLYLSTNDGELTNTPPSSENNALQNLGTVVKSDSNGIIKVGGAGRTNATPNLDHGNFFIGDSNNKAVSSAWTLPYSDGASGQVLVTNGTGATTWTTLGGGAPTVITANTGLAANTEYVISNAVTSNLTLSVPLSGGGYTPAIGDTIKIRNTTDNDIIIQRYSTASSSLNPLRYWNGDVVPNLGASTPYNRYKELTIEGKGEITLINQDGGGTYVDWWVHHNPAVEWEIDSIGANGALYYDADKRAVTIAGTFEPPLKQVTGNLSGGLKTNSYYVEYGDSNNYTISLPSRHNEETVVQNLASNGSFYIENRGEGTLTLNLVEDYIYVNPNTYRAYLQDYEGNNIAGYTLTISKGEKYIIETVLDPNPLVLYVYYKVKMIRGYASTTAEGSIKIASNAEATAGTNSLNALVPSNISSITLNQLNDVTYTAGSSIDGYALTYAHATTSWVATALSSGSSAPSVTSLTSATNTLSSPTLSEEIYICSYAGNITVEMISASTVGEGFKYTFKKTNSGAYDVDISVNSSSSDTIDNGVTTVSLGDIYSSITLVSDGTSKWYLI